MRRFLPLTVLVPIACLMAGCAAQPESAARPTGDKTSQAFSTYLSARFAAGEHDLSQAAHYYGQSLSNDPGNPSLLALSFFYSTTLGDFEAAGKYAQAVVAATPDDRAARLALAVVGFKHKDYADVRKQLSLSAKGPFTVLTLSLFDAWAAAAQHDGPGVEKDLAALASQKGAESMAVFHTALSRIIPATARWPTPPTRRRWLRQPPRRVCWKLMAASWSVRAGARKPPSSIRPISTKRVLPMWCARVWPVSPPARSRSR